MFPLPLHIWFEIGALFISILLWKYHRESPLRWFPFYLSFIVLVELSARYIRKELHQPNAWLYNLTIPVEYTFFTYLFYSFSQKSYFKRIIKLGLILFPIFVIVNLFFIQGIAAFNSNILLVGSCLMITYCIIYFYEIYSIETNELSFWELPMNWIALGIFVFNAGEFTYNLFSYLLINKSFDKGAAVFKEINNNLILFLYTLFSIGFICSKVISEKYKKA